MTLKLLVMKKLYFVLIGFLVFGSVEAQIVNIPDANFKAKLLAANPTNHIAANASGIYFKIDANNDGEIQQSEALQVGYIDVHYTNISSLDGISSFTNLKNLNCSQNNLSILDVSALTMLQTLDCSFDQLQTLNISGLTNLLILNCSDNNLTDLDVSNLTNLQELICSFNQLSNLNINGLVNLLYLDFAYNWNPTLDVSNLIHLQYLDCSNNELPSINVSGLTNLITLKCYENQLPTINVSGLINLQYIDCSYNLLPSLNVNGLTNLQQLYCSNNQLPSLNVNGLTNLQQLYCSYNQLPNLNVNGLTNLQKLYCSYNQLSSLNVNGLTNLQYLDCSYNQIPSLTVSGLTNLQHLDCSNNQIPSLTISGLTNLQYLDCSYNQLPSLNVGGLTNLQTLYFDDNQMPNINLNGLTNLQKLGLSDNQISNINLSGLVNLYDLGCNNNLISSLDVSSSSHLQYLFCENNINLTTLLMKNGSNEPYLYFDNDPNLQYICADEGQINDIQDQITFYGYTNCHVNSYCSFVPGGTFYTIHGNNRYDEDNNGCSPTDINYPNLKLSFTDGTNTGNLIPDTSGAYRFDVQAGTQTFTPMLENPVYFNISPTTATVTFPTSASPYTQDFCITANGTHNDLEVILLPIDNARPGFDAYYEIIYKNKGTNTQSGTVNLTFNDSVLDYVSSALTVDVQTVNNLTWNFSNLAPFETRVIDVVLNLNSPTEVPPLNSGDILNYTATVTGLTDETPADNTSILNQTVVNGYDPNYKTCTEGTTVAPSTVGQYVHYMIGFENTGTANAQNIVVKDMIDTTKYDITSLVPINGSADFTTRITNTNQVEFIFQNINLPFTTGSNDGYVAFKIKTKPTLVVGDTFSNTANIYFDYNAPIVTNTTTTTIAALANPTFAFSDYFTLSPIPTKGALNITTKQDITISSISIYNTLGQVMLVTSNPSKTIDVSNLTTGSYFIKVITDKGTSSGKFMKE